MEPRNYPQRGDLVRVVEGGRISQPIELPDGSTGWSHTSISVMIGATFTCLGRAWENESDEFYRTNRPTVWVNSPTFGKCWVDPDSWYPVEGPPVEAVLKEQQ